MKRILSTLSSILPRGALPQFAAMPQTAGQTLSRRELQRIVAQMID
ncbi:hypothetical protein [Novosphingobium album (ex Liu et al. 2023)]|uniref:Uncharacterized protein n=1 Tax=Novosphingobium album (ex Liu et al. 2023) TaxID=3031130 RepID=A0ABT5WSH1_9SPHN|nr:hypothetical protein [Novosphingobium album (ex Liu et al. 2023)]MDE8652990.1 hypothetical protein [Novosphingobium album (ex Liu et al. 2023)]